MSTSKALVAPAQLQGPAPHAPATPLPSASSTSLAARGNLYSIASQQFEKGCRAINMDPAVQAILSQPKNELIINFPVRMDSGEMRIFKGYRVQHNNILGPFKGGIRIGRTSATGRPVAWRSCSCTGPASELASTRVRMTHAMGEMLTFSALTASGTCACGMYIVGRGSLFRPPSRTSLTTPMIWRSGSLANSPMPPLPMGDGSGSQAIAEGIAVLTVLTG